MLRILLQPANTNPETHLLVADLQLRPHQRDVLPQKRPTRQRRVMRAGSRWLNATAALVVAIIALLGIGLVAPAADGAATAGHTLAHRRVMHAPPRAP